MTKACETEAAPAFRPIAIEDRSAIEAALAASPRRLSEYSFSALAAWSGTTGYVWAHADDGTVLVATGEMDDDACSLLMPLGPFGREVQSRVKRMGALSGRPLQMVGVPRDFIERHRGFVDHCEVRENPAAANYIYDAAKLAALAGKAYHNKRNLIAQFQRAHPGWEVEPLTIANRDACLVLADRLDAGRRVDGGLEHLQQGESGALNYVLRHLADLGQAGLVIKVAGEVGAFSIWEPLSEDTAVVHFERADHAHKGLAQLINRETAVVVADAGFRFINREEDLGHPGLRQAKRSYHPVHIEPSHILIHHP